MIEKNMFNEINNQQAFLSGKSDFKYADRRFINLYYFVANGCELLCTGTS